MLTACLSMGQLAALVRRSPATIRRYEVMSGVPTAGRDPVSGRRIRSADAAELIRTQLQLVTAE
jgi:hypothetical protein